MDYFPNSLVTLSGNSTYWIVEWFTPGQPALVRHQSTTSSLEDTGGLDGWKIGDAVWSYNTNGFAPAPFGRHWEPSYGNAAKIGIYASVPDVGNMAAMMGLAMLALLTCTLARSPVRRAH